jgi:hypothetical protein
MNLYVLHRLIFCLRRVNTMEMLNVCLEKVLAKLNQTTMRVVECNTYV